MFVRDELRAVLFDMDETLLEHTRSFEEIGHQTYDAFGDRLAPVTREEFWETFWEKAVDLWNMMFDGAVSGAVARRYSYINTLRALKADEGLAEAMMRETDRQILASTRLFGDTRAVLSALRSAGLTVGIVTNGYTELQRLKLEHHGLCGMVDFTLVSEEAGAHKPDVRIFDRAAQMAQASPGQCVFVGDMLDTDIKGANDIGMTSVLVDIGGQWVDLRTNHGGASATATIKQLSELLPLLGVEPSR